MIARPYCINLVVTQFSEYSNNCANFQKRFLSQIAVSCPTLQTMSKQKLQRVRSRSVGEVVLRFEKDLKIAQGDEEGEPFTLPQVCAFR